MQHLGKVPIQRNQKHGDVLDLLFRKGSRVPLDVKGAKKKISNGNTPSDFRPAASVIGFLLIHSSFNP